MSFESPTLTVSACAWLTPPMAAMASAMTRRDKAFMRIFSLFLSWHQCRIAHIDDRVGRDVGLQQIQRFVPGDLVDNVVLVDAAFGLDIGNRLRDNRRRRAGE